MRARANEFKGFARFHIVANRSLIPLVATFALISLSFIPPKSFFTLFDKNAAPQFMSALLMGVILSFALYLKRDRFQLPIYLIVAVIAAISLPLISLLLSSAPAQGLTGDTFRYNGLASLYFLIVVAALHGLLDLASFIRLMKSYLAIISIVEVIAVLQHFSLISLPGIQGTVTATFGNLDFLSAFIGTSLPLILFAFYYSSSVGKWLSVGLFALSSYVIYLAGAKQGYLDLVLTIGAIAFYFAYSKVSYRFFDEQLSIRAKTTVLTVLLLLWLEFIFIVPFADLNIPHVSDDPQVAIRGVLWLAAFNQFKSAPLFGVGPDQYGNYYEQFRTISSITVLPGDSSNDAHSAPLQTLATLGITGSVVFVALIAIVIYSSLKLYRTKPEMKRPVQITSLFIFIFISNAAISPIVLANRYLMWAVGGFLALYLYRSVEIAPKLVKLSKRTVTAVSIFLIATMTFTAGVFAHSQLRYLGWGENNMKTEGALQKVSIDAFLPCQYYFPDLIKYTGVVTPESTEKLSLARLESNPRCYSAVLQLSNVAAQKNDMTMMRKYVYQLMEMAPARRETLDMATSYAIKAKDKELEEIVRKTYAKLGIMLVDVQP